MGRMVLFILGGVIGLGIWSAVHYWFYKKYLSRGSNTFKKIVIFLLFVSFPLAEVGNRIVFGFWSYPLAWLGFLWMGVLFYVILFSVGSLVLSKTPLIKGRRGFLKGSGILAGSVAIGGFGVLRARFTMDTPEIPIYLKNLPKHMDGFRIALLSDIHIGFTIHGGFIEDLVTKTNSMKPDAIAITGDIADGPAADLGEIASPFRDLRASIGTFYCTGNHDYYSGVTDWLTVLRNNGLRVLRNERVSIGSGVEGFELAGVDDLYGSRFESDHGPNYKKALGGIKPERECVLLAHQPKQIQEAARYNVGLQLSGHTHGGQLFPIAPLAKLQQGYVSGRYSKRDTQMYVSRGSGYWGMPMRVAAPPEIANIVLRSGKKNG